LPPIDDVEVVVGEPTPLLLDVALELLPVPFQSIPVHDALLFFCLCFIDRHQSPDAPAIGDQANRSLTAPVAKGSNRSEAAGPPSG
jgi:hypothetical protein